MERETVFLIIRCFLKGIIAKNLKIFKKISKLLLQFRNIVIQYKRADETAQNTILNLTMEVPENGIQDFR